MHVLDTHINDIEARIRDISESAPKEESPSIQESLSTYDWILLDSWIAWRTLRFLLKDNDMSPSVQKKWFQTPSSYTASQLKAVWGFSDEVENFIFEKLNVKIKKLIDEDIQKKRNACAHFSGNNEVNGNDYIQITQYYNVLSVVFRHQEFYSFLVKVVQQLGKTIDSVNVQFDSDKKISLCEFPKNIMEYSNSKKVSLSYEQDGNEHFIVFTPNGCKAGLEGSLEPVTSETGSKYIVFGNKGYYRNIDSFIEAIKKDDVHNNSDN